MSMGGYTGNVKGGVVCIRTTIGVHSCQLFHRLYLDSYGHKARA